MTATAAAATQRFLQYCNHLPEHYTFCQILKLQALRIALTALLKVTLDGLISQVITVEADCSGVTHTVEDAVLRLSASYPVPIPEPWSRLW